MKKFTNQFNVSHIDRMNYGGRPSENLIREANN